MFYVLLCVTYVHSSFAIILMGKRELVALLVHKLSSWCLVIAVWHFLAVLSAVCDCGSSFPYSLTILFSKLKCNEMIKNANVVSRQSCYLSTSNYTKFKLPND